MTILSYIFIGILILLVGFIFIRVFAFGIAKSVIEAIQQSKQFNKQEKKNGIKKETSNARQVTKQDRTERKDKKR